MFRSAEIASFVPFGTSERERERETERERQRERQRETESEGGEGEPEVERLFPVNQKEVPTGDFIKIKTLKIILFKTRTTSNYLEQEDKNLTKNRVSKETNMRLRKTFILCKTTQKSISENLRNKFDNIDQKSDKT